jgi:hypothetical protein
MLYGLFAVRVLDVYKFNDFGAYQRFVIRIGKIPPRRNRFRQRLWRSGRNRGDQDAQIYTSVTKKNRTPFGVLFFLVAGRGFEPPDLRHWVICHADFIFNKF